MVSDIFSFRPLLGDDWVENGPSDSYVSSGLKTQTRDSKFDANRPSMSRKGLAWQLAMVFLMASRRIFRRRDASPSLGGR